MLLTIRRTEPPATELGYLLGKHPDRCQTFSLGWGEVHIFYPEVSENGCTAALLLDLDPVALVRKSGAEDAYVNDRPYVASSFMAVALAQVFRSALAGHAPGAPEAAERTFDWEVKVTSLGCRGGEGFLRRLFEPLGYTLEARRLPLDDRFLDWGPSHYFDVTLRHRLRLADLLGHLYVLLPVLGDDKHYWVGADELEKLLRHGEGWLATHPEKEEITRRYLLRKRALVEAALARLSTEAGETPQAEAQAQAAEEALESKISLDQARRQRVVETLVQQGARSVLDLGCGEGRLLKALLKEKQFERVWGADVSVHALAQARRRLDWERMPRLVQQRIELFQASAVYRDSRFANLDAICLVEVIEHLDPSRLEALERVIFGHARPKAVILTTPNFEYNQLFVGLAAGRFRHGDHRFEWTRAEFQAWSNSVADRYGYQTRVEGIGPVDPSLGTPTQLGVFSR